MGSNYFIIRVNNLLAFTKPINFKKRRPYLKLHHLHEHYYRVLNRLSVGLKRARASILWISGNGTSNVQSPRIVTETVPRHVYHVLSHNQLTFAHEVATSRNSVPMLRYVFEHLQPSVVHVIYIVYLWRGKQLNCRFSWFRDVPHHLVNIYIPLPRFRRSKMEKNGGSQTSAWRDVKNSRGSRVGIFQGKVHAGGRLSFRGW